MAWSQERIKEIYNKAQKLAATDAQFRKDLLQNANAAIEKLAGESLPNGYSINVIESNPNYSATFVLPATVSGELHDDDLEMVAGGMEPLGGYICGCKNQTIEGKD